MKSTTAGMLSAALAVLGGSCIAPEAREALAAPKPVAPSEALASPPPLACAPGITVSGKPQQGALLAGKAAPGMMNLSLDGQPVRVAADGSFIIGFGRDAPAESVLRATLPNGQATELKFAVAARAWPLEHVAGVRRFAQPSAEFARLRPAELAAINAARRIDSAVDGWRQKFAWPTTGRVSGFFGAQRLYANGEKGDPHSGVDIARPTGTPVVAPADGVVILAADRPFTLEGNLLMIDHGMGLNSAFLHLSRIDVQVGDRVRQGQLVGAVGATGRASGPHLHWAMKWLDRRLDPLLVAGPMPATR